MAPRQRRVSPQPSLEERLKAKDEAETVEQRKRLFSDDSNVVCDVAREQHDLFNLYCLILVLVATAVNWDLAALATGHGPTTAYNGRYFWQNWAATLLYFCVDLLWVVKVPQCVKSPGTIVKHHIVAMAYLSGPVLWPKYRWFMGACLTIEINTWFLIARRIVYKRAPPAQHEQAWKHLQNGVDLSFYASWIAIRMLLYPAIFVEFMRLAWYEVLSTGVYWHPPMIMIPLHLVLCILNLKWSYDLFRPMITRCWKSERGPVAVASGL